MTNWQLFKLTRSGLHWNYSEWIYKIWYKLVKDVKEVLTFFEFKVN